MGMRLYVGNIPFSTTEQDLQDLFGTAGQVASVNARPRHGDGPGARVRVRRDGVRGGRADGDHPVPRTGFGGRSLTVNEAKPRPERSGGFGGGGGSRRREPRW